MANPKIEALLDQLLKQSAAGKLRWQPGIRAETFQVSFSDTSVVVRRNVHDNFRLGVYDERGSEVWEISTGDDGNGEEYREQIAKLFELARKSAFDPDKTLDKVLGELNRIK